MSWSTAPEAPQRKTGPAWTTTATLPQRAHGPGWFTPLEKVAAFTAAGTLTAAVTPQYPAAHTVLNGSGRLTAAVTVHRAVAAAFSSTGQLFADAARTQAVTAVFTASGSLSAIVNDGLTAIVVPGVGVGASFTGGGGLVTTTGDDGLTATVVIGSVGTANPVSAIFGGAGALSAVVSAILTTAPVAASFTGLGTLRAGVVEQLDGLVAAVYGIAGEAGPPVTSAPVAANFVGGGALSAAVISYRGAEGMLTATVTPGVVSVSVSAALTGSGALTATAVRRHLMTAALAGSGALTATTVRRQPMSAALAGAGTLTATVVRRQPMSAALAGSGTLTATATAVSPPANPKFDTLSDDFNAGIGANWTKAFANNAAEVTASGGAVRIDHTAASEYNLLQSVNNYDLTGSYAHVQVTDFGNQALASQQVILGVLKDANNRVAFFGGGNQLIVESFTGGVKSTVGTPITLNTTAHRWLRIRESGGTLFFDTAPDGTTWTNRFSQANPWAVTAMAAHLACGNWQAEASASYAIFDNFNTAPTGPSQLTDDFNRANSTTTLGTNWTTRAGTMGIISNAAYPVGAGGVWCQSSHNTEIAYDDMEVSITVGAAVGGTDGDEIAVILGANAAGEAVTFYRTLSTLVFYSQTGWGYAGYATRAYVDTVTAVGDVLTLRRIGNTYTGLVNGTPVSGMTWTDSGNDIPRDSSHRLVGIASKAESANRTIDSFYATSPSHLTGVTYSQSSVYPGLSSADYSNMNDGNASGADDATGCDGGATNPSWLMADIGSTKYVGAVTIGYDYLTTVAGGGYGPGYAASTVEVSTDGTSWTLIGNTPDYSSTGSTNGLVNFTIGTSCRYVRLTSAEAIGGWLCVTEFQLWGT